MSSSSKRTEPSVVEARFASLVQSPLRERLLRFLHAHPHENFDVEALARTSGGKMRGDVENCLREVVDFGVARRVAGSPPRFTAWRPERGEAMGLLDTFLEQRATVSHEDQSPAVQRFLEGIGRDEKMLIIFEWIRTAAKSDIAVLILGPTGSGKEVVANMIHDLSRRNTGKFQALNCAALPDSLFESEMFGYEKGAFTGAYARKPGRVELAQDGTLFLDEIGDLSPMAQAKLLRVLEEHRHERLGGHRTIETNFRLISATNRPLDQFVRNERFREDLYYRVNAFSIRLPSLRERATDIPTLAHRLLARYFAANGLPVDSKTFTQDALDLLSRSHWPGNFRELESTVSRAALTSPGRTIRASDVEFLHTAEMPTDAPLERLASLREAERAHIVRVLDEVGWNKKQASEILEISRGTLYRKISEYGLEPEPNVRKAHGRPRGSAAR